MREAKRQAGQATTPSITDEPIGICLERANFLCIVIALLTLPFVTSGENIQHLQPPSSDVFWPVGADTSITEGRTPRDEGQHRFQEPSAFAMESYHHSVALTLVALLSFSGLVHTGQRLRNLLEQRLDIVTRLGRRLDEHDVEVGCLCFCLFRCHLPESMDGARAISGRPGWLAQQCLAYSPLVTQIRLVPH